MTSLSSLTRGQIRMLIRLGGVDDQQRLGVPTRKMHTIDMGLIIDLMKLELVEITGIGHVRRRYQLTPEGRRVRKNVHEEASS